MTSAEMVILEAKGYKVAVSSHGVAIATNGVSHPGTSKFVFTKSPPKPSKPVTGSFPHPPICDVVLFRTSHVLSVETITCCAICNSAMTKGERLYCDGCAN